MIISYVRIPLYNVYLNAVDDKNLLIMSLLNWFVGKIIQYFHFLLFALFGVWVGLLLKNDQPSTIKKKMFPVIILSLIIGVAWLCFNSRNDVRASNRSDLVFYYGYSSWSIFSNDSFRINGF